MIVLWLIAGSLLVAVPYYLFYDAYNLWPSVYAGGVGAAVYLIALVVYFVRMNKNVRLNVLLGSFLVIFLVSSYVQWTQMDTMTSWQRSTLGKIRTVIGSGIFMNEDVIDRTIPVYAAYHKQKEKKKNIVSLFNEIYAGKLKDGMFPSPNNIGQDFSRRYVHSSGDTLISLVSVDTVARGRQADFKNANGSIGRLQTTTTLSAQEVRHERNN